MDNGEPRWLNASELEAWKAFSALLIKMPAALDAQLRQDSGLTTFEYLVLAGLSEAPERTMRMSVLAALANGSLSRLSHVVTRLEKRGHLRREPCPDDGRYTNAVLTEDGYRQVVEAAPGHLNNVRSLVVDVLEPEQIKQLGEISARLLHAMDPDFPCPGQH
ncbi:MarR family winged helix-turn-helix transcriptional regulator [Kitasatospora sp. SUK 42]|uniref:MarR family winged helix-turn-helix transcriptional regulator n=1 Tax=Kitasatospora sp. SUK 42 TaxID=1588882 RepID=UPI0018CA78FF|nr:MarR family transcriptional regulator [Kitasatospora sp. SUK 42]MBV2153551.1 MarR family transcriptional regulator [Kitasatospora sp. SUK 42]